MSFAVVLEGMTLAAFAILLVGGKQKREQGWGVLTILVALAAFAQAIGMALMVREAVSAAGTHGLIISTGLFVRKRREVLLRMVSGQELDHVHHLLELPGLMRGRHHTRRHRPPKRRRLRIDT